LAIGWHFFFEGIEKIRSVDLVGPSTTNRPWSSQPYLRESNGPLAPYFRDIAGDPDREALELFAIKPLPSGQDPSRVPPRQRLSPALDRAWNEYFDRFAERHHLSTEPQLSYTFIATLAFYPGAPAPAHVPWAALYLASEEDPIQLRLAQARLDQAKDQAARALMGEGSPRETQKSFGPSVTVKVKETFQERVSAYRSKVKGLQELLNAKLPAFGRDVEKQGLTALKAEVNQMRTELLADLERPLQDSLNSVLTEAQKRQPSTTPATRPPIRDWNRLDWVDAITRYGLTAVGAGLLLGLFTRLSCLGGACFLLMFYLAMPAFPWLPEGPRAEGHYLFINKNIIEMLALLALATTQSGRWAGLDGLIYLLMPWRRRSPRPSAGTSPGSRPPTRR
jgi:uncharacterized membrane protein YphA (DoxX/SURF4 family)